MGSPGLEIQCRHCGTIFLICRPCYRGHRYCGEYCQENGYKARRRAARRKHEASTEGRQDHRDRQQEYRNRQKAPASEPLSLPSVPDKAFGCQEYPLNPIQTTQLRSALREPETTFGIAGAICSRCGCEIVQIYGGTDEFFKKTSLPRDQ